MSQRKEIAIAFQEYKSITKSLLSVIDAAQQDNDQLATENAALKRALRRVLRCVDDEMEEDYTGEFAFDFKGLEAANPYPTDENDE